MAEPHKRSILTPAGCNKRTYASEREARESAKRQRRHKHFPAKLIAYKCRACPAWHLTASGTREP